MLKRLVWLGIAFGAAACSDDGGETPIDAAVIDGDTVDAPDVDAPPPTYGGTISVLEVALLNPGTSGTFFGQGIQVGIAFTASDQVPAPVLEEQVGSPFGCKAWQYTRAQAIAASVGNDEGTVQISGTGTSPAMTPACVYVANAGYACPHTNTASAGGTIAAGPQAGTLTLTDADVTFNASNTTGRYLQIAGAATAANNGVFPIVGLGGINTIVFANPAGAAETLPGTASHVNLAGVGPTPMAPDPGFLADDGALTFALTPGGGNHFAAFTVPSGNGTVGNDFTLPLTEANKLNAIPLTGAQFTIACDATGCPGGSASGTILNIVTTDGAVAGLSPFAMPLPTTRRIQIRCASLQPAATNGQTMTIPAAYSALLMTSGATRIQASFIRPLLMGSDPVTSIAGHAIVGFTTVP